MRFRITIELNRAPKPIEQEPTIADTCKQRKCSGDPR